MKMNRQTYEPTLASDEITILKETFLINSQSTYSDVYWYDSRLMSLYLFRLHVEKFCTKLGCTEDVFYNINAAKECSEVYGIKIINEN